MMEVGSNNRGFFSDGQNPTGTSAGQAVSGSFNQMQPNMKWSYEYSDPSQHSIEVLQQKEANLHQVSNETQLHSPLSQPKQETQEAQETPARMGKKAQQSRSKESTKERKDYRKVVERKRRAKISQALEELRSVVPACSDERMKTTTILEMAILYIQQLTSEYENLLAQNRQLLETTSMYIQKQPEEAQMQLQQQMCLVQEDQTSQTQNLYLEDPVSSNHQNLSSNPNTHVFSTEPPQ